MPNNIHINVRGNYYVTLTRLHASGCVVWCGRAQLLNYKYGDALAQIAGEYYLVLPNSSMDSYVQYVCVRARSKQIYGIM